MINFCLRNGGFWKPSRVISYRQHTCNFLIYKVVLYNFWHLRFPKSICIYFILTCAGIARYIFLYQQGKLAKLVIKHKYFEKIFVFYIELLYVYTYIQIKWTFNTKSADTSISGETLTEPRHLGPRDTYRWLQWISPQLCGRKFSCSRHSQISWAGRFAHRPWMVSEPRLER